MRRQTVIARRCVRRWYGNGMLNLHACYPRAAVPGTINLVLDSIAEGERSYEGLADRAGYVPGAIRYYVNAARWLGYLNGDGWTLTIQGVRYVKANYYTRADMLAASFREHLARKDDDDVQARIGCRAGTTEDLDDSSDAAWERFVALPVTTRATLLRSPGQGIGATGPQAKAPTRKICPTCHLAIPYALTACETCEDVA